jgi:hypothetical protein
VARFDSEGKPAEQQPLAALAFEVDGFEHGAGEHGSREACRERRAV